MRTLKLSRALKECKEDKARLYKECDTLTSHLSRDLKTFEKHFGTTAQKIRAEIQRQREQQQRMTAAQKERFTKADQEMRDFLEAKKVDPELTYHQWQADRIIEEMKRGDVMPPTPSEFKNPSGGRKTRRKRRRKKKKSRRKRKTHRRRKRRKTRKRRR